MDIELFRSSCLALVGAEESMPFGDGALVFKVGAKMFALLRLDPNEHSVNLKCDPQRALELREEYPDHIIPGYHMNKKHWNTLYLDHLGDSLILELLKHSYDLVFQSLPKKVREAMLD